MQNFSWIEAILAGLIAFAFIFWYSGGIKTALERSRNAPKDWQGAIIPLVGVVLFVILLIMMVR